MLLAEYLLVRGGDLLSAEKPFLGGTITAEPEALAKAVGQVCRAIDLRSLALRSLPKKDGQALFLHVTTNVGTDHELTNCLRKFAALDARRLDDGAKQAVADVGVAAQRWLYDEYLESLAGTHEPEPATFGQNPLLI